MTDCDAVFTGEGGSTAKLWAARLSSAWRDAQGAGRAGDCRAGSAEISATDAADAEVGLEALYEAGVTAMFSINRQARDFAAVRPKSASNLAATMAASLRVWQIVSSGQGN